LKVEEAHKVLDDIFLTMCPTFNMHSEEQSVEGRITAEQHAVLCKAINYIPVQDAEPTTIASDHVSSDIGRTAGAVPATGAKFQCKAREQGTAGGNDPADCDWPDCGCCDEQEGDLETTIKNLWTKTKPSLKAQQIRAALGFEFEDMDSEPEYMADIIDIACQRAFNKSRETLVTWMLLHGFSARHGDTLEDLLQELHYQVEAWREAATSQVGEI
jgi:hypothetical protein